MLLFELDFEEVSKKKLRECWSQLCRIRCMPDTIRVEQIHSRNSCHVRRELRDLQIRAFSGVTMHWV